MRRRSRIRHLGFSLLELTIAMALGLMVLAASVQLYSKAVGATWLVTQRAEMQQDFRSAANILTKDISMAGSGLGNNVQIALPSGAGTVLPVYGCDQTPRCYINGGAVAYPTQLVGGVTVPYLYGLMPGWTLGPTIQAAAGPTDVITVANADTKFLLNCYNLTVLSNTVVQFTLNPIPVTCVVPPPLVLPQAINDPVIGLTPGDLVLFNLTIGVGAGASNATVLAEVTNVQLVAADTYNVTFAAGDPLRMNQPAAAAGSLGTIPVASTGSANRINVITYYLDNTIVPPRLMRQISGHSPIPVAENVSFMQFTYDLYDFSAGAVVTAR